MTCSKCYRQPSIQACTYTHAENVPKPQHLIMYAEAMCVHHVVLHLSAAHGNHLEGLKGTGCSHNGICRGNGWYDVLHHPLRQLIGYSLHSQQSWPCCQYTCAQAKHVTRLAWVQEKTRKSTPLGIIKGASRPTGSLRLPGTLAQWRTCLPQTLQVDSLAASHAYSQPYPVIICISKCLSLVSAIQHVHLA